MLSNEVLLNILDFMDRKGLDTLQITSQLLQSLVEKEFVASPLRLFGVCISEDEVTTLSPRAGGPWVRTSLPQLNSYLRSPCEKVDSLHLLVHFTEEHLRQLIPLAEHFIGIHLQAPTTIASVAVFTGLFTQLVRCRSVFFSGARYGIPASFFSLPAIRDCASVVTQYCSVSISAEVDEAIEWLHSAPPDVEKRLMIDSGYAVRLIDGLKERFESATERHSYLVRIHRGRHPASQQTTNTVLENRETGERLMITVKCHGEPYPEMWRDIDVDITAKRSNQAGSADSEDE